MHPRTLHPTRPLTSHHSPHPTQGVIHKVCTQNFQMFYPLPLVCACHILQNLRNALYFVGFCIPSSPNPMRTYFMMPPNPPTTVVRSLMFHHHHRPPSVYYSNRLGNRAFSRRNPVFCIFPRCCLFLAKVVGTPQKGRECPGWKVVEAASASPCTGCPITSRTIVCSVFAG